MMDDARTQLHSVTTASQTSLLNLCDALVALLDPFAEVVLHDWETQTIVHLSGKLSDRKVGDPSFIDDVDPYADDGPIFGPYRKTNPDGRQIKSISVLIKTESGAPASLMCINIDISRFDAAQAVLSHFISVPQATQSNPLADDWLDTLNSFVAHWRIENGLSDDLLIVEDRRSLLSVLHERGVFDRPKAADAVSMAIKVSRATIYSDLKQIEQAKD
jgi:predicted transcriptional regulator YheO